MCILYVLINYNHGLILQIKCSKTFVGKQKIGDIKENSKFEKYCGKGANMSSWGELCKH